MRSAHAAPRAAPLTVGTPRVAPSRPSRCWRRRVAPGCRSPRPSKARQARRGPADAVHAGGIRNARVVDGAAGSAGRKPPGADIRLGSAVVVEPAAVPQAPVTRLAFVWAAGANAGRGAARCSGGATSGRRALLPRHVPAGGPERQVRDTFPLRAAEQIHVAEQEVVVAITSERDELLFETGSGAPAGLRDALHARAARPAGRDRAREHPTADGRREKAPVLEDPGVDLTPAVARQGLDARRGGDGIVAGQAAFHELGQVDRRVPDDFRGGGAGRDVRIQRTVHRPLAESP